MQHLSKALILSTALLGSQAMAVTLTFNINKVKNDKGRIYIQIFKGQEAYKAKTSLEERMLQAKQDSVSFEFNNLEPGDYSVSYYHDENGNERMDTNVFHIPTEGYGFSNNAKAHFGPPSFADMKIRIIDKNVENHSDIHY